MQIQKITFKYELVSYIILWKKVQTQGCIKIDNSYLDLKCRIMLKQNLLVFP